MSEKKLADSIVQLIKGIEKCLESELIMPCLMLIYSGIDIGGWLSSFDPSESVKNSFVRWADKYINSENNFNCSSTDLYSARCGLLHRLNADSRISEKRDAKLIVYYTKGEVDKIEEEIRKQGNSDKYVAIKVEKFAQIYREGILRFFGDLRDDPDSYSQVKEKAERSYMMVDCPLDEYTIAFDE